MEFERAGPGYMRNKKNRSLGENDMGERTIAMYVLCVLGETTTGLRGTKKTKKTQCIG